MTLLDSVRDICERYGKNHCWIALSGGLDSRVLLDLCHALHAQSSLVFHVIHVHHGLSPHADAWALQCENISRQYGFDFHLARVDLSHSVGESLEEAAREARYQVFASFMQHDDLLLSAHHQDDQAETILLQLLRGAGPKGLSAMPVVKSFARGRHGRPLLTFSRHTLLAYAESHQLIWVDDESNENRAMTRNFIRHDIMPALKARWPNVEHVMSRSAKHCAEAQALLEEAAHEKLNMVQGARLGTLSCAKLLGLSAAWQRLLLRTWIEQQGHSLPDTNKLTSIQKTVLGSAWDRVPCVKWAETEVRRHRDDVYILAATPSSPIEDAWEWDMATTLSLPSTGMLAAVPVEGRGLRADIGPVTVRFRARGEMVEVSARGRLSLKNLLQEWRVPVWERGRIPLIFCGDMLVQALGYFMDPAYAAREGEAGVEFRLSS